MNLLAQRQKDPEYLQNVIKQRQIIIEQLQNNLKTSQNHIQKLNLQVQNLQNQNLLQVTSSKKQILNLNLALKQITNSHQSLLQDKNQLDFNLNLTNLKVEQISKDYEKQIQFIKNQFQLQKESYQNKISKLQANISSFNSFYHTNQKYKQDRLNIIQDSNRDMRGFSNQKQSRIIILQNQQYANQIQFQSKNITSLLQKNQKLQEQIKYYKRQLDIHKGIQNDLVKRSSLAQSLIKQLNKRIRQLQSNNTMTSANSIYTSRQPQDISSHQSTQHFQTKNNINLDQVFKLQQQINSLNLQLAQQKNYARYLQNKQDQNMHKYQTLAEILSNYLQTIHFLNDKRHLQNLQGTNGEITIDITNLKSKDIKQWTSQQMQAIISMLLIQVKPYLSKQSLSHFPQMRNVNISFVEEPSKQPISLPKISQEYQKAYEKESKRNAKFKDIPLDISTKILRSNLRQWGKKISYGNPAGNRKYKSKSTINQAQKIDKSLI